jgi:MerR family transcriptional regulator, light-induced transcriptional regulator
VLALSATMSFHLPALRTRVTAVRAELGAALPIIVGGHALQWSPGLAAELGVETAPATPEELVHAIDRLAKAAA